MAEFDARGGHLSPCDFLPIRLVDACRLKCRLGMSKYISTSAYSVMRTCRPVHVARYTSLSTAFTACTAGNCKFEWCFMLLTGLFATELDLQKNTGSGLSSLLMGDGRKTSCVSTMDTS